LNDTHPVAGTYVVVENEADLIDIERDACVHVHNGKRDDLELHLHEESPYGQIASPTASQPHHHYENGRKANLTDKSVGLTADYFANPLR
jgi:hypothetical protein